MQWAGGPVSKLRCPFRRRKGEVHGSMGMVRKRIQERVGSGKAMSIVPISSRRQDAVLDGSDIAVCARPVTVATVWGAKTCEKRKVAVAEPMGPAAASVSGVASNIQYRTPCERRVVDALAHAATSTAVGQGLGSDADDLVFLVFHAAQIDILHGVVGLAHGPFAAWAVDGGALHGLVQRNLVG